VRQVQNQKFRVRDYLSDGRAGARQCVGKARSPGNARVRHANVICLSPTQSRHCSDGPFQNTGKPLRYSRLEPMDQ
jgi:hypothetical protein